MNFKKFIWKSTKLDVVNQLSTNTDHIYIADWQKLRNDIMFFIKLEGTGFNALQVIGYTLLWGSKLQWNGYPVLHSFKGLSSLVSVWC